MLLQTRSVLVGDLLSFQDIFFNIFQLNHPKCCLHFIHFGVDARGHYRCFICNAKVFQIIYSCLELFIVGDEGDLGEVSLDGFLLRQQRLLNVSFEGITTDPVTGLLYVAIEGEDEILSIDPASFGVVDRYALEQHWGNRKVFTKNKHGLEGITLVQDPVSGNSSLWITNQVLSHDNPEDVSGVFQYTLSDTAASPLLTLKSVIESETLDLAGIFYHPPNNRLYVVSDKEDLMLEMDLSGKVFASYELPGKTQEGITRDDEGFFYIAQDNGGVLKLRLVQP